jgi:hypothetical protein
MNCDGLGCRMSSQAGSRLMIVALAFTAEWDIIPERHALVRRVR